MSNRLRRIIQLEYTLEKKVSDMAHKYPRSISWYDLLDCLNWYRVNKLRWRLSSVETAKITKNENPV